MTPPLFLSSSNDTTQPLSAVLLIYSLFQKIDSESERIFQKAKENIMKGKRIIAVCITPSCHHCNPSEHPNTSSTGSSKRHLFPDLPGSKDSLTSHSPGSVVQGQWEAALLAQRCQTHISPVPELLGQVQCHAKPRRNSTSNHIPVHKSHFSLGVVAAFSSVTSLHHWLC